MKQKIIFIMTMMIVSFYLVFLKIFISYHKTEIFCHRLVKLNHTERSLLRFTRLILSLKYEIFFPKIMFINFDKKSIYSFCQFFIFAIGKYLILVRTKENDFSFGFLKEYL